MSALSWLLGAVGIGAVLFGSWLIFPPAAFVLFGLVCVALSLVIGDPNTEEMTE